LCSRRIQDDALGTNQLSLSGADADAFEIDGLKLYLKAGIALDFEVKAAYSVTLRAADDSLASETAIARGFTLSVIDVNESPTALGFTNTIIAIAEGTPTASRIKLADVTVTDDALGDNTLSLTGADASSFALDGLSLYLKAGVVLDFEAQASLTVSVAVADRDLAVPATAGFTLTITDVNEHPTEVQLANAVTTLPENTDTAARLKLADIVITDKLVADNKRLGQTSRPRLFCIFK